MEDNQLKAEEKIEMLKYNISRFDHYFASVNFKSSFLVLGNITILGFILTNRSQLNHYLYYILTLLIAASLISVLLAIKPYLKSSESTKSIIYFNDIANTNHQEYDEKAKWISKNEYINDLREQSFTLSKGLQQKFMYLNIATVSFIFTIVIFFLYMGFFIDVGSIK